MVDINRVGQGSEVKPRGVVSTDATAAAKALQATGIRISQAGQTPNQAVLSEATAHATAK